MKMSPPWGVGVFQAGIAVVERDAAIERLVELDFGPGEAEAAVLWWDLEAPAFPLHHVVVADDAFVPERADALEVFWSRAPGFGGVARGTCEAAVVVGDEAAQHAVGGVQVVRTGEAEFAAQTVLEHAPEAFDAAFGLWRLCGDEGDAEFAEGAAELRGLALAVEFFLERPVGIVTHEDAAAIAVKGRGHAEASKQALQQVEIAFGRFREEELSGKNFAGGIILHAEKGEARTAACEPVVRAAVELHEFAFASHAQAALAMSGSTALARGAEAFLAQEAAQGFAAERETFDLVELFAEMMVVEAGILGAVQAQDRLASALGRAARAGPAAVGVSQRRLPVFAQTLFQALNLAHAQAQESGGAGTRHVSFDASSNDVHSLQFLPTQRECLLSHRVTFSRCR